MRQKCLEPLTYTVVPALQSGTVPFIIFVPVTPNVCRLLRVFCSVFVCVNSVSVSLAWPAATRPPPPPRQFFRRSSGVIDFPYGDLSGVMSVLKDGGAELLFVMYYAPWCAQSMAVREEFGTAARYMDSEVSSCHLYTDDAIIV